MGEGRQVHRITRGLDLPMTGEPMQAIDIGSEVTRVALLAADFPGLKPTMAVETGNEVLRGEVLFHDKRRPDIRFTAPGAGRVIAVNRGERRALLSVVVELSEAERRGDTAPAQVAFDCFTCTPPTDLDTDSIRGLLLESGLWTALRTRPFSQVADPATEPQAIFVTAMDSHPLAPSVETVLAGREDDFETGLVALAKLTPGTTYLCTSAGSWIKPPAGLDIRHEEFSGPHPAGTVGLHIHLLEPVHRDKCVWTVGYQDVAAIGHLFNTGHLDIERIIALAGPALVRPRLVRTRLGAATDELADGELHAGANRIVSGSVLGGRAASGEIDGYLGRYHNQLTVLREGHEREFLGWLRPGRDVFSITGGFLSSLDRKRRFGFSTSLRGSPRPMVPIGTYEQVMPMDVEPTFLLRSLITGNMEQAEALGCLELDEEDLALCTFVCPGKYEYGPLLRKMLDRIQREA